MTLKQLDTTTSIPAQFGGDPTIWATWLYYAESRTQAEVASALGVSRASVANYLAEARRRGLVSISVAPDLLEQIRLSASVSNKFSLDGVFIAPHDVDVENNPQALRHRLGIAGAQTLATRLTKDTLLGVAWGRTMVEVAGALPMKDLRDMRVVQVSGSSLGDEASSPEACTLLIAGRLGAKCHNFHAPAVVTTRELRDALLAEPTLVRHFERLTACSIVVFGVGELTPESRWADGDNLIRPSAEEYINNGGAGVLIGRFIDGNGRELEGPLSGRQIGMELDILRKVPTRLCIAGGAEKLPAIRATLAGGYVTHLVTDMKTAQDLVGGDA